MTSLFPPGNDTFQVAAIRKVTAIKVVEEELFSELGEPESFLDVDDADADAFTNEVIFFHLFSHSTLFYILVESRWQ